MPTGQPDSVETHADRLIREAMEAGRFDDLPGVGEPIPGAGSKDDAGWWIRGWLERNRANGDQGASNSE
ncbi:MAG TPA: DnaJ family domain-containing protein [Acidimicrobiia bacterium]